MNVNYTIGAVNYPAKPAYDSAKIANHWLDR